MSTVLRLARAICELLFAAAGLPVRNGSQSPAPSDGSRGSGVARARRALSLCVGLACTVAVTLALGTAPALADVGHDYQCQLTIQNITPGTGLGCQANGGPPRPGINSEGLTISNGNLWALWVTTGRTTAVDEFDPSGQFASQIPGTGGNTYTFPNAASVAVNDSTGTVYVPGAELNNTKVDVFAQTGAYVTGWDGSTTPSGLWTAPVSVAVDNTGDASSGDVYVADSGHGVIEKLDANGNPVNFSGTASYISGSEITGTPSGAFPGTGGAGPFDLNNNPSDALALDAAGDIFVADYFAGVVYEYTSSGTFVQSFTAAGTPAGSFGVDAAGDSGMFALAVDNTDGDLLVSDRVNNVVDEFSIASGAYVGQITGASTPAGAFNRPTGVAVDTSGDVYVSDSQDGVIDKFGPAVQLATPTTSPATLVSTDSATLNGSVDPANGGAVSGCQFQYGTSMSLGQTAVCAPAAPYSGTTAVSAALTGLQPDTTYYYQSTATDAQGTAFGQIESFTTTGPPTVDGQSAAPVAQTSATLQAQINPHGFATSCEFEYGTTSSYGTTVPCPAALGSGTSDVGASVQLTGLTPDTTYHFEVVASSSQAPGGATGGDRTFTTPPVISIDSESTSAVTYTGATLDAQINPEGIDTTYHFEYGTTSAYGTSIPIPDADIGSGTSDVNVSQVVTGLTQNTTYHFRVVATNALAPGGVDGPDHTFSTPPAVSIDSQSVSGITDTTATLKAQLNPGGLDTTYQFQYGTSSSYSSTVPANPVDIGSGTTDVAASVDLTGLTPGTTYHFRVTASNSAGTNVRTDQTFKTYAGPAPTGLPDGRAYEQVTPAVKDNGEPFFRNDDDYIHQAALDGNRFGFFSFDALPGSQSGGGFFLATRGSTGWSTANMIPPQGTESSPLCVSNGPEIDVYSADMSTGLLQDGGSSNGGCAGDDPPLVAGEPLGVQNLFVRDNTTNSYQLVDVTPAGVTPANATFDAASADLSHVVFDESAPLTSDAPSGDDLYDWSNGTVHLVTYLPSGTPTTGALAGGQAGSAFHAVSDDGSKIFFTAGGNLYVRENDSSTVQVDATQGGSGPGGGGQFQAATADGSVVYFTDDAAAGLTSNTVPGSGANLYSYNTGNATLTDLTPAGTAQVQGLSGLGNDGSYVYFVADGALAKGATAGENNLYVLHGGPPTFIATLGGSDSSDWNLTGLSASVSDNGRYIAFQSRNSLTGYNNDDGGGGPPDPEIFVYDAGSGQLQCASCIPTGVPPSSAGGARVPGATINAVFTPNAGANNEVLERYVTDSGQVFFDTTDPLLPTATNDKRNVYEYENGNVYLISTGNSPDDSIYQGVTSNGSDVFFATTQQLVPQDTDGAYDIYDARVGGGFPYTAPPAPCTSSDTCSGAADGAPAPPTVASVTFFGPGNASATSAPTAEARVLTRTVHGATFMIAAKVPGAGRITITGAGIRTVHKSVSRPGTYKLRVTLTPREKQLLSSRHNLRLLLRTAYSPPGASTRTASVRVTVLAAPGHRVRHARRASIRRPRGAR